MSAKVDPPQPPLFQRGGAIRQAYQLPARLPLLPHLPPLLKQGGPGGVILALLICQPACAASEGDQGLALRQNVLFASWPSGNAPPLPAGALGTTQLRLRAWSTQNLGETTLKAAIETQAGFSTTAMAGGSLLFGASGTTQSRPFEIGGLNWESSASATPMSVRIDRLDLGWRWGDVDFDLGRQPISIGTSHTVGVLDVLAPFSPGNLDSTYKAGIDALRIRTPLTETQEAELIVAGVDPLGAGGILGRMRTSLFGQDLELIGGHVRQRNVGGLGWEGELGGMGFWGELALFQRRPEVEKLRGGGSWSAFSGVVGTDVSLPGDFKLGASMLYQDFGARSPQELASVYTDAPYKESWVFLGESTYGVIGLARQLHPLLTGSVSGICNLVDGSMLLQPRLTYGVADNADLGAYGWIGLGSTPQINGTAMTLTSEFGMVPSGAGLYARWFF